MADHVKILAWLFIAYGGLLLASLLVVSFGLGVGGFFAGQADAAMGLPMAAALVASAALIFGLPGMIAGWGMLRYKRWARILAIILSILNLPSFPLGTALGVYGLWVLFDRRAVELFRNPPPPPPPAPPPPPPGAY